MIEDAVPATTMLRAELAACHALIGECARLAADMDQSPQLQAHAAASAARLATASAQAASAIARLADADTRQRLATAKIDADLRPRFRNTGTSNRRPQYGAPLDSYRTSDWENAESEAEKSQFDSGPRVRRV